MHVFICLFILREFLYWAEFKKKIAIIFEKNFPSTPPKHITFSKDILTEVQILYGFFFFFLHFLHQW